MPSLSPRSWLPAVLLALTLAAGGCTDEGIDAGEASPGGGSSPILDGGEGDGGGVGGGDTQLRGTIAEVEVSGDLRERMRLNELAEPVVFAAPPGALSLTWTDRSGSSFGLGVTAFEGTRETGSATGILTLAVAGKPGEVPATFVSQKSECELTIEHADGSGVAGSAVCEKLPSADGKHTVDVVAEFSAEK